MHQHIYIFFSDYWILCILVYVFILIYYLFKITLHYYGNWNQLINNQHILLVLIPHTLKMGANIQHNTNGSYHESPHSLLLNPLLLLILLPLCVRVPGGDGFGQLQDLAWDRAVELLEVLSMLQDAVQVLLERQKKIVIVHFQNQNKQLLWERKKGFLQQERLPLFWWLND